MMNSTFKITFLAFFLAAFMVIGTGQPANADLADVGGVNPVTGFPFWFQDANALSLGLCDEFDPNLPVDEQPPCLPELTDPALGVTAGNIIEALFYSVESGFTGPNGESFLGICGLEAVEGGAVINFARIRLDDLTVEGNYTVDLPCGSFGPFNAVREDPLDPESIPGIDFVEEELGVAPGFAQTLVGPVQIFADNGTGAAGFLGDAVTPAPLSEELSPGAGTLFAISGAVTDQSNQFTVVGKIFALAPVGSRAKVTFTRNISGAGTIDFMIPQSPGAVSAQAVGVESPLPTEPVLLTLTKGAFRATVPITADDVLPENVEVTFNLGVVGETTEIFPLTEKQSSLLLLLLPKQTENKE